MEIKILKELVTNIIPGINPADFTENDGLPCKLVNINSLIDGKIHQNLLNSQKLSNLTRRGTTVDDCQLRYGDVVVSERGPVFKAAMIDFEIENCFVSMNLSAFRLEHCIQPQIVVEYLNGPACQQELKSMSRGSKYLFVKLDDIMELKIPVPPQELQKKLVGYCDTVNSYLACLKKEEALIRDLKQHILASALEVPP
ncbi:MAG: restriction endonuclease subunit S [Methanoregula sp.]|nr:restriction endonuclease subunit S [Methanoregula sp.]